MNSYFFAHKYILHAKIYCTRNFFAANSFLHTSLNNFLCMFIVFGTIEGMCVCLYLFKEGFVWDKYDWISTCIMCLCGICLGHRIVWPNYLTYFWLIVGWPNYLMKFWIIVWPNYLRYFWLICEWDNWVFTLSNRKSII